MCAELMMPDKVDYFIRCDGNEVIGLGHIFGALDLSSFLLTNLGKRSLFLIRPDEGVESLLKSRKQPYIVISAESHPQAEISEVIALARQLAVSKLVINFSAQGLGVWQDHFKTYADKGLELLFQDNPTASYLSGKVVINSLPHPDYEGYDPAGHRYCLDGLEYKFWPEKILSLLRTGAVHTKCRPLKPERVLIAMGGSDENNLSLMLLQVLEHIGFKGTVDLVLGHLNRHRESIETWLDCSSHHLQVELNQAVDDMPERILAADFGISALGLTTYEMFVLGCPAFILPANKVNEQASENYIKRYPQLARSCEWELPFTQVAAELDKFINDFYLFESVGAVVDVMQKQTELVAALEDYFD